jgi:ferritin-like metal-binding protein YciE
MRERKWRSTRARRPPTLDPVRCAGSRALEIARYGTLRTWAEELRLEEAVSLLQQTLDEEEATDEALTALAEAVVNQQAQAA